MLLRKLSTSVCSNLMASLNNLVLSPVVSDKNSIFSHSPAFHIVSRVQFLHSSHPALNNPKQSVCKSVAEPPNTQSTVAIPRVVKADAQAAFFDYLHYTRGFSFRDAEYISKNSPRFLEGLTAKVESKKDVFRALTRFLRYHPVNEFEPFFESIGLSRSEFAPLLPQGSIFLSDNQLLLDNYHTLIDYGLPRSEIGTLYKEVKEIFRYECGVLDMKLRAYEQLGFSISAVIKLVSCSPQLLVGEVNHVFADVLERMRVIGFDSNWILVHLSSRNTYNWNRILDTLCILCELGFSDAEMEALFREDAALLLVRCGKQVYVVAGSLLKLGLKMKEVLALVLKYRKILLPEGAKNFSKTLYMLYELGTKPESIVQILSTHMEYLASHSLKGLRTVLKEFNGDMNSLRQALEKDPSAFFNLALKTKKCDSELVAARNRNNTVAKTDFLLRLGYIENSDEMVKAFKLFEGRGDQLQERFDCLVDGGLDFHMVSSMVKQAPAILNQKKETLEEKIDFLKNYLGYLPVESIRGFPSYLGCGMERIRVRFSMYAWLREKGCVEPMRSVSTLVALTDAGFVKYYVDLHPNGPAMWQHLKKKSLLNG